MTNSFSAINSLAMSSDGATLFSVSQDSSLRVYSLIERRQTRMQSTDLAASCCMMAQDNKTVYFGSLDNNMFEQ